MTPEELFHFDLRGYVLFPAVLSPEEIAPIKAQCVALHDDPESLPPGHRSLPGGPAAALIDHPRVMGVINTVISRTEKTRLENCFLAWREAVDAPDSGYWETYGCPPGSLLIFSEAMRHTTTPWTHAEPRCALFFCYNSINVRHHKPSFSEEMLADLTPERRRFFNEVYHPQFDKPPWTDG